MTQSPQSAGFSGAGRRITEEDEIKLTSVGVDIGSSTSHLVFSRLELKRQNTRYVIVRRTILRESDILLTPYVDDGATIDADALGKFIDRQYKESKLQRDEVPPVTVSVDPDTGDVLRYETIVLAKGGIGIPEIIRYEDYREVHGVRIPFRLVSSNEWSGRIVIQYDTIEANVEVNDDIFTLSPPAED